MVILQGMLGNKYGWRPVPVRFSQALFTALYNSSDGAGREVLTTWYKQDVNDIHKRFWLLPFSDSHPMAKVCVFVLVVSWPCAKLPLPGFL